VSKSGLQPAGFAKAGGASPLSLLVDENTPQEVKGEATGLGLSITTGNGALEREASLSLSPTTGRPRKTSIDFILN